MTDKPSPKARPKYGSLDWYEKVEDEGLLAALKRWRQEQKASEMRGSVPSIKRKE